jgi:hypothetical protein
VERPGVEPFRVFSELDYAATYEPGLVTRVVDRELPAVPKLLGVDPQDAGAERVEGRDPHLARVRPDEQRHPILHLRGRFVGKRDGEYLVRRREPLF